MGVGNLAVTGLSLCQAGWQASTQTGHRIGETERLEAITAKHRSHVEGVDPSLAAQWDGHNSPLTAGEAWSRLLNALQCAMESVFAALS
jgi:hypothetical protein